MFRFLFLAKNNSAYNAIMSYTMHTTNVIILEINVLVLK